MRRAAVLLLVVAVLVGTARVALASSTPDGVVGPYTWHQQGTSITVGYVPCRGWQFIDYFDPYVSFWGRVKTGSGSVDVFAHDLDDGDLQRALNQAGDYPMPQAAYDQLHADEANYVCGASTTRGAQWNRKAG